MYSVQCTCAHPYHTASDERQQYFISVCTYYVVSVLLYSSLVEEFILPLKKVIHRLNDATVTRKLCAMQVFFQQWKQVNE